MIKDVQCNEVQRSRQRAYPVFKYLSDVHAVPMYGGGD